MSVVPASGAPRSICAVNCRHDCVLKTSVRPSRSVVSRMPTNPSAAATSTQLLPLPLWLLLRQAVGRALPANPLPAGKEAHCAKEGQ
jgi:hypothetical protein